MATTAQNDVSPLAPFDLVSDPPAVGHRWVQWKRRFETYLIAVNLTNDAQKRALLLYQAGEATQDMFDSLTVVVDEAQDYGTTLVKLDHYFLLQKNMDFIIFKFRQVKTKILRAYQSIWHTSSQVSSSLRI